MKLEDWEEEVKNTEEQIEKLKEIIEKAQKGLIINEVVLKTLKEQCTST